MEVPSAVLKSLPRRAGCGVTIHIHTHQLPLVLTRRTHFLACETILVKGNNDCIDRRKCFLAKSFVIITHL